MNGYIYICIHTLYVIQPLKKEWNPAICNTMNGPWQHYVKWNKSVRERKDKYCMIFLICGIWKKPIDIENRLVVTRAGDEDEGVGQMGEGGMRPTKKKKKEKE